MSFDLKAHLKMLCAIHAPSGHEALIRDAIRAAWGDLVDEITTDGLGSLIATRHGSGPEPRRRVMLCAHMDEIGLIVAEIVDGFIRTSTLGGIDYRTMLHQPVIVHGRETLAGLFGAAPPHMVRSRKQYPEADDLWIDLGLPAERVHEMVRVGDIITVDAPPVALKGERFAAKALDNRASVAAVTLCLHELAGRAHAWDVVAVASAQEETFGAAAAAAAYLVEPDIALVLDVTFGAQRGTGDDESFALGEGPTISRGPNLHPGLLRALRDTARDEELKLTVEPMPGSSGTDAWAVQVSRTGIPTALLGIPLRNMHSPSEVVDLRDIRRTARLMSAFIARLDADFLDSIAYKLPDAAAPQGGDA